MKKLIITILCFFAFIHYSLSDTITEKRKFVLYVDLQIVPKIPIMKIADMMEVMAPEIPKKVIGLRPGEKIHEVLISEEDTTSVLELPDRFIICPPQDPTIQEGHEKGGGKIVSRNFRYASNNNGEWLTSVSLSKMLAAT